VRSRPVPFAVALALGLAFAVPARAAAPGGAATGDVLPFPAAERTLANGLRVIIVPTGFPDLVSVQIAIQTGSRNEVEPGKTGFAHFFEHMMFRGTKAFPPERYQGVITRIGARQNAYTSDDLTNYHVTFAKEDLEKVLEIEADRFQNLDYSVEAFKTESRAILGEYNKNASNPLVKLDEAQRDRAFRAHPYKHTTMGFLRDIEDMPGQYDYSRQFYARWYRPEYATVIVAGDVTPDRVLPLVERYFGRWKRGTYRAEIPAEPPPAGPVYAHVEWTTPTLPWVTVAFHGPAFSETAKDWAAVDLLFDLSFGETSDLHRKLVVEEQKVDALFPDTGPNVDPGLVTVSARLKRAEDATYVRDQILQTFARARASAPDARRLADQQSHLRNAFVRRLDSTDAIAATVARFAQYRRSYGTVNALFRTYAAIRPADLQAAARTYFTDERLVIATLSKDPLPAGVDRPPRLASLAPEAPASADQPVVLLPSKLPVVTVKLVFPAGSARDPKGKEGLAALAADLLADGGSRRQRIDEIKQALHPLAASFAAQVDREMATLTGRFPSAGWERFAEVALPQLTEPGLREEDFTRLRDEHLNALVQDLRESNDEELGKERLQANLFAGTPYGHPALGTVAGLKAITLDDVRAFVKEHYVRPEILIGVGGDAPQPFLARLQGELAKLPRTGGPRAAMPRPEARRPKGIEVEIVEKDTRAAAISFGHPIEVTRGHPDFVALWVAKTWLGEHRSSTSHLYHRIREARGMNYGDYAYVEAFPRGMFQFFPDPNLGRRAQLFEIWIRPVLPANAPMAIKIAVHELRRLVDEGLTAEEFEATRAYLMKNVFVMTARQEQQVGYALDSRWYGIPEFTRYMRDGLAKLTRDDVNRAVKRHLSGVDLSFVVVTKDAKALADALVSDGVSTVKYDAEKPPALLEEDRRIGALKLGIRPEAIRVTPAADVFAR
jgi:zinc protease